jgi:aerobic C4-dicarboxylate transport protein
MKRVKRYAGELYVQVLCSIALGALVGYIWPTVGAQMKPLSDGFLQLIKMVLAPVIFGIVVVGIARMGNLKEVGRVGLKAMIYFEVVTTTALIIGMIVANVVQPGAGMNVDPKALDTTALGSFTEAAKHAGIVEFLLGIIPSSAVDAFAKGNMLQVILFSVLFGIGLGQIGRRKDAFIDMLDTFLAAMFGIVRMVMRLAPIGAFGGMAFTVGKFGAGTLASLGELVASAYLTSIFFVIVLLGLVMRFCGLSVFKLIRYFSAEILIVVGTASTESVLPQMMTKLEAMGCEKTVVGLAFPAGYAFNADGVSIYMSLAALFIAQATNTHLSWFDQITLLGVMLITSKGSAGVAGAGFIALAATLSAVDQIPVAGLVVILGVDRFVNEARAVTNLIGNAIATVAVARWEGELDLPRARAVLNGDVPLDDEGVPMAALEGA